nr:uncharacterized protein LOC127489187 [Oryctolagus cuniculus]
MSTRPRPGGSRGAPSSLPPARSTAARAAGGTASQKSRPRRLLANLPGFLGKSRRPNLCQNKVRRRKAPQCLLAFATRPAAWKLTRHAERGGSFHSSTHRVRSGWTHAPSICTSQSSSLLWPGKAVEDGSIAWTPTPTWETPRKFLTPGFRIQTSSTSGKGKMEKKQTRCRCACLEPGASNLFSLNPDSARSASLVPPTLQRCSCETGGSGADACVLGEGGHTSETLRASLTHLPFMWQLPPIQALSSLTSRSCKGPALLVRPWGQVCVPKGPRGASIALEVTVPSSPASCPRPVALDSDLRQPGCPSRCHLMPETFLRPFALGCSCGLPRGDTASAAGEPAKGGFPWRPVWGPKLKPIPFAPSSWPLKSHSRAAGSPVWPVSAMASVQDDSNGKVNRLLVPHAEVTITAAALASRGFRQYCKHACLPRSVPHLLFNYATVPLLVF